MQAKADAQLLREYVRDGSEAAFGEIVARYTDLIYSAVLRQGGSADLAEEVNYWGKDKRKSCPAKPGRFAF